MVCPYSVSIYKITKKINELQTKPKDNIENKYDPSFSLSLDVKVYL